MAAAATTTTGSSELSPLEAMQKSLEEALRNPERVRSQMIADARALYGQALVKCSLYSHEEIQRDALDAKNLMTKDIEFITESMMDRRDEILAELELQKMLPPALLAQMKANQGVFKATMRHGLQVQKDNIHRMWRQKGLAPETEIKKARKLMRLSLKDPEAARAKMMENLHTAFGEMLDNLSKVTPQEMQKSISDELALVKGDFDSIVDPLLDQRWSIIAEWQALGKYPPEEISLMKADPDIFEMRLRLNLEEARNEMLGNLEEVRNEMLGNFGGRSAE